MLYSCELGRPVRFAGNDAAGADARLTGNTESADGPSSSRPAEQGGRSFRDASTYRLAHAEVSIHCEPISSAMHHTVSTTADPAAGCGEGWLV